MKNLGLNIDLESELAEGIDSLPVGVALFDARDRPRAANRFYRKLVAAIAELPSPAAATDRDLAVRSAEGARRWYRFSDRRTRNGGAIRLVYDITERRARDAAHHRMQRAGQRREDDLQAIVDNISQAVLVVGAEGHVSAFNPRAIAMFGVTAAAKGTVRKLEDFIPADFALPIWQWHKHPARPEAGAFEHQMGDGKVVAVRTNPMPNGGFVATFTDVTERAQSAQRLHESQKMEALGLLAGGVAHEFNNLLTAIGGFSKMALRKLEDTDFVRDSLDEVAIASDRAANLIQQMLAFGCKQPLEPRIFAASKVIHGFDRMLRSLLPANVDLSVEIADEEVCIWVDPDQMSQVILNLVLNARDAMPEGGQLTIGLAIVEPPPALRAGKQAGRDQRCVAFCVTDTGTGIEDTVLPHVFEPFFTTKEPGQGSGLGLSVAHSIVERLGGIVEVETALGRGTTFRIYLPVFEPPLDDRQEAKTLLGGSNCETILLVEDEPGVRKFADTVLSSLGYRVLAAADAGEAMARLDESGAAPDLLLTDIVMPDQSGPQLAAALLVRYPGLRVVFITGYADRGVGMPTALGSDNIVLRKPFSPDALGETVRTVLDGAKAAANSGGGRLARLRCSPEVM